MSAMAAGQDRKTEELWVRVLWLAPDTHLECAWAQYLLARPDLRVIVPRFGASDCNCTTHLVYAGEIDLQSIHLHGKPRFVGLSAHPDEIGRG